MKGFRRGYSQKLKSSKIKRYTAIVIESHSLICPECNGANELAKHRIGMHPSSLRGLTMSQWSVACTHTHPSLHSHRTLCLHGSGWHGIYRVPSCPVGNCDCITSRIWDTRHCRTFSAQHPRRNVQIILIHGCTVICPLLYLNFLL